MFNKWWLAYLLAFLSILMGCNRQSPLTDPFNYAPTTASSSWSPLKRNTTITSKYCTPLFPKEYKEQDSLTLAELIDIALMNNPLTKQSWANARSAAAQYGQSLSPYLPELEIDATYTRERQSLVNTTSLFPNQGNKILPYYLTTVDPEARLAYIIYDFGKRKSTSESAKQALYYADWMHNWQIQDVMQSVMSSYYEYQYQIQSVKALVADLENASTSLDAASRKLSLGTVSVGDVVQAKTIYLQTKIELISQKNQLESSLAVLISNLGLPANNKIKIEELPESANIDFVLENLDSLVLKAENMRQDFLAAQAKVKYSVAQLDYAKSAGMPNIDSYFEIGRNYYNEGIHEDYHFQAEFMLTIPLFKGLYYKNGIRSAQAKLLQAQAFLQQTELDIVKEVTISHCTVASAAETLVCSKDYLAEAEKRFDIALASYKAGTVTILDVISAQSSLADARAKNALSKRDWFSSIADLAYYTGALCSPAGSNNMDKCYEK